MSFEGDVGGEGADVGDGSCRSGGEWTGGCKSQDSSDGGKDD